MDKEQAALEAIAAGLRVAQERAPAGITVRRFQAYADLDAMAGPHNRAAQADGEHLVFDAARLAADLAIVGWRPETSLLLAEADGAVVGCVRMGDRGVAPDVGRILGHTGCVDPAWRRRGIGSALLAGAQAALREIARLRPVVSPGATVLESEVQATAAGTVAMLERGGYHIDRYGIGMVRWTLDDPPSGQLPPGIEWRPVRPEDCLTILIAMDEAMRDHPGWTPFDEDELRPALDHPLWGQTDVWQVAWEGDTVVAGVLGHIDEPENLAMGRRRGYTECIFTRRPWRRRGIAGALIGRNLRLLRERGLNEAALGVDTDNPTGALRLYQRVGFEEEFRVYLMRRPA